MAFPPRNKRKSRSSPERETKPPEPPLNPNMPSSSSSSSSWDVNNFSYPATKPLVLPPGYEFVPDEKELILCYLKPFSKGDTYMLENVPIHRVNIYESSPQELSEKFVKGNKNEWFFLSERIKVANGGKNQRRCDKTGYWNASVAAKKIKVRQGIVGYKRVLNYYLKKKPKDVKEDWLMYEYWLESSDHNKEKVDYALCKMYLNPKAVKKKQAEEEEHEEMKYEEGMALVDTVMHQPLYADPLYAEYQQQQILAASVDNSHQLNQLQLQQPHDDIAFQQEQWHCPFNLDDFPAALIGFEQQPMFPEGLPDFLPEFNEPYPLDGDGGFNNL